MFVDWDGEGDFVLRYREQPQQQQEEEDPIPRPAATMCHGSESASCRINQPFDYSPAVPRPPIAHARYHAAAGQDHRAPVHEPVLAGWCGADYDGGAALAVVPVAGRFGARLFRCGRAGVAWRRGGVCRER